MSTRSGFAGLVLSNKMSGGFVPIVVGDYESIATVSVGSGGSSTITFSSIPATFKHLQIRGLSSNATGTQNRSIRINTDTGANYAWHQLTGDGANAGAASQASVAFAYVGYEQGTTVGATIIDILDYANTNKNKVVRAFGASDANGSGLVHLRSGLWINTAAITQIQLYGSNNFAQYSHFALYGIKG
jgi:hypothetical protein